MAITSRIKHVLWVCINSILMRVIVVILSVTVLLLIIQAVIPVNITENMIFSYKHSMLMSEAETIASSLNTGRVLTRDGAEEVMAVLGASEFGEVVITDAGGAVLYSSEPSVTPVGFCALYPEIVTALRGNDAFRSEFTGESFESFGAIPIVSEGNTTGCVYLVNIDHEQAALVTQIQNTAFRFSLITVFTSMLLYFIFMMALYRKNERMLHSIRAVREGDYAHRIDMQGHDEYATLASEFNALTDRLQETEKVRRQFVSDASHELRTPLAAIRLLSDSILQNDMDQETLREFIQDISGEAERLTRMTSKLLSLTALDSRQFEQLEYEPVDLSACCKKAVRMLTPFAAQVGAEIEESTEEKCLVRGREDDIFQLVLNLSENGIKYSQQGGRVRLIAYAQGEYAILIVEDNGIGIPEQELNRIFERFYRVDKARSREAGGTGLGLAIARETVEKLGGTVEASNRPQGGARFTVKLPLYRWEGEP